MVLDLDRSLVLMTWITLAMFAGPVVIASAYAAWKSMTHLPRVAGRNWLDRIRAHQHWPSQGGWHDRPMHA